MKELIKLAALIRERNQLERDITAVIGRPAEIGHIGEFIASKIFQIELETSASKKSLDGHFIGGNLKRKSVNIKWYAKRESILDITPDSLPDYYLALTGPKSSTTSSRGQTRPWVIDSAFLFESKALLAELKIAGTKVGTATSVRKAIWKKAEIYPDQKSNLLILSKEQREALALFSLARLSGD